jgi:hypothetical protein
VWSILHCCIRVTVKMGPRFEMGKLLPSANDGWKIAVTGKDFAGEEAGTHILKAACIM